MNFIYEIMNPEKGEALAEVKKKHVEQLPIRPIDFTKPAEKAQHDRIVAAVTELLALNRRLQTETFFNPQERVVLERRAASLDHQIDDLVFDLYGLTPEERALCE